MQDTAAGGPGEQRTASAARRFLGVSLVYGGGTEESHAYDRLAADLQEWQMPAFAARDASVH